MQPRAMWLGLAVLAVFSRAGAAEPDQRPAELKLLDHFIGAWDSETVAKKAEWTPEDATTRGTNDCRWTLGRRFVRDVGSSADGSEHFGFWTYDPQARLYKAWFFFANGNSALELTGRWDAAAKVLRTRAELGNGITATGVHRFPDKDTYEWTAVTKDKDGKVYLDLSGTHRRRAAAADAPPTPAPPDSPEMKVLARWVGRWKTETTQMPAVWTPSEAHTQGVAASRWVAGGKFLHEHGLANPGKLEHAMVATYDPARQAYRSWYFHSAGFTSTADGRWDPESETMTWVSATPDGIKSVGTTRWIDKDRLEWRAVSKDAAGKIYNDGRGSLTRLK